MLDTHALIWFVQSDRKLGPVAKGTILREAVDGNVLIPAIVIWETAQLARRGKVDLGLDTRRWASAILMKPAYRLAPLEPAIAIDAATNSWLHKDPADRMIVATARHRQAAVLTADRVILTYAAAGHVGAIDARR